jgi:hypothetical protein
MATSTQEMSITQGLAELKLLTKRINGALGDLQWVDVRTKMHPVDEEKLRKQADSELQSFLALTKRRDAIKRAIVMKNATTVVKIGSWEGTIAEAIEYKNSITFKSDLLAKMKSHFREMQEKFEEEKKQVDYRLERLLQSELGKDVRTNPETITALQTSFRENNKVEFVDPLGLQEKIKALDEEIEGFLANVDWVLSEANGRTMIRI